jgi:seryl-tRNA synthetase
MLDLKWIRENGAAFDAALKTRGFGPQSSAVLDLDAKRRTALTKAQELQTRRNEASRQIGQAKAKGGDAAAILAEVASLKDQLQALEEDERKLGEKLDELLAGIPNVPAPDVPVGPDANANVVLRKVGAPPHFDFTAQEHFDIGTKLGMDFDRAAKMSGARFVVLKGPLARLERALAMFMLDVHTREFGYTECYVPRLVRSETMFNTGQLPKFADDLFRTTDDYWLIPTAEVSLTNLVAGDILEESSLPLRFTALTSCYRAEAGAAGKDTRGMIRQHQFGKVELVSIAHPDRSNEEHERMTACAEEILRRLGLAYRVVVLSTGDMGFAAQKTYDIEVWLPGQNAYREISSCSNCGDFQARRMKARFKPTGGKGTRFVHTLNGSGLAVGRTLIGVLENYQRKDGSVEIPPALRPYMDGMESLAPDGA